MDEDRMDWHHFLHQFHQLTTFVIHYPSLFHSRLKTWVASFDGPIKCLSGNPPNFAFLLCAYSSVVAMWKINSVSVSANPSHRSLPFLLLVWTDSTDSPVPILLSISVLLVFLLCSFFYSPLLLFHAVN